MSEAGMGLSPATAPWRRRVWLLPPLVAFLALSDEGLASDLMPALEKSLGPG